MNESPHPGLRQAGLVVHPSRDLTTALDDLTAWAEAHGLALGQVRTPGHAREVAEAVEPEACDLLIAVGGDGTALSALHAGGPAGRPVLGIACGSIGALTSVDADRVGWALDQVAAGRWTPVALAALDVACGDRHAGVAINDLAIIRDGSGQATASITVDDVLFAQVAGDGVVVATALGSSAYTMAAGGPLLAPGAEGMAVTPLAPHGGACPPLVAGPQSVLALRIEAGYGGVRCELDGRPTPLEEHDLTIRLRAGYATLVTLADEEPRLTGLRRRGLVLDSPRVIVRDERARYLASES